MESRLKALFDYQRFEGNNDLQRIIDATHARYGIGKKNGRVRELTMDELDYVAAAGSPYEEKNDELTRNGTHLRDLLGQGDGVSPSQNS